ncbi:MAG: carbamoyltransferase HypF [Candidatus Korobacteraceae bacterium]|jgi:hydrogenase maturation protein HypF
MLVRKAIEVSGIVQGVGFRPYIYRLAHSQQLAGTVCNTASGVTIEVQGPPTAVEDFLERLPAEAPLLARITGITVREIPCNDDHDFQIVTTHRGEPIRTLISPDIAVCSECLREMFDPADRRYRYPFINCTNCGPRFTIVRNIPYDRPFTSMAAFRMCPACQAEYDDPHNRRFHAQPNACWTCGPQVELWDLGGKRVEVPDPIAETAARLQDGQVVAVKGLGGFHLACDAINADAVRKLRERKRRVEKPFAIMVPDLDAAERFCEVDSAARQLLLSPQRPIALLRHREDTPIAEEVAPFNRYLGVFLPYTPLHHLLFAAGGFAALVMTSANVSEEPICIANDEAVRRLRKLADCFLVHNRDILLRCDDSVTRVAGGRSRQLRRSRGFVPVPVFLREDVPSVLAVGGELKNTICLTKGRHAFLSQHIGDLENAESYSFFEEAIEHLQRILEMTPVALAYDLHPNYFSTRWALAQSGLPQVGVQHHHAHIASCMAENNLEDRVIGIALDGTGYGTDGRIWGGEVLLADYCGFERAAHLAYVPLPGGEAAIREPWRMAVSYLVRHFGSDFVRDLPLVADVPEKNLNVLFRMMEQGINSPLTSSCGRLFDAVAALAGIRRQANYEAQAAIELEMATGGSCDESSYPFDLGAEGEGWAVDTRALFEALLNDIARKVSVGDISRRFHNGLEEVLCEVATRLRQRSGLERVCLSGGTFQNVYLFDRLCAGLRKNGFQVFTHSEVPAGDGGLSLGQALVAARRLGQPRVNG